MGSAQGLEFYSTAAQLIPLLMIVEDAHWIDPTSLELLTVAVDRVPQLRVLLIITARPQFTPPWPPHAHVSTVLLTRLGRSGGAAIIDRIAGGKTLPEGVTNQILPRTKSDRSHVVL